MLLAEEVIAMDYYCTSSTVHLAEEVKAQGEKESCKCSSNSLKAANIHSFSPAKRFFKLRVRNRTVVQR